MFGRLRKLAGQALARVALRFNADLMETLAGVDEKCSILNRQLSAQFAHLAGVLDDAARERHKLALQSGWLAASRVQQMDSIDALADVEFRVFSQFGEDGIIEWLVHQLAPKNRTFIEFGVENYKEANTRFLLLNRNWTGLVMDGSAANMDDVRATEAYWRNDLQAHAAFITAENINDLIRLNGFSGPLGLLSIDLDGNDYWILSALGSLQPDLLILECNPIFGDRHAVTVPYDPQFDRARAHQSGLLFGASIRALRDLAESRGYEFLGTCSNGLNAFFVRRELYPQVSGKIRRKIAWPAIHRDGRDAAGRLSFSRGRERFDLIADGEVFDCRAGVTVRLRDLGDPYSEEWLRLMSLPGQKVATNTEPSSLS